jgi:hypothetical protein
MAERCKTELFVSYDLLCEEAVKKYRSLNTPQSHFKPVKDSHKVYAPNGADVAA